MERLKNMKETLMSCVQGQITHLDNVDTKELGEVIDMIKDLSEAVYYCTITEAMEGNKDKEYHHYYTERYYGGDPRMMDPGRMYYPQEPNGMQYYDGMSYYNGNSGGNGSGNSSSNGSSNSSNSRNYSSGNNARGGGTRGYSEHELTMPMHDEREGRSHMSRKTYMEYK